MGGMLSSPLAKGVLGGIAGAGLMRMLGGGHHYGGGGLFGAPHIGGYFGGGMGAWTRCTRKATKRAWRTLTGVTSGGISENKALLR